MTIFVNFTMGVKEAYFFNSPTHWAWHNLPPDVEALFVKTPPIKDVIELALGDSGTYFVSYRDDDGQIMCRHYNLPNPLTEYLYHGHPHVIRDLSTLSISIGPYESYYAHDKSSASWSNLPPALEKAVLSRLVSQDAWKTVWKGNGRDAPSFVSLGADGSYFMRTVGGGGSWDLKSKEEGMAGTNKWLEGASNFSSVAGLYLFPNNPNSYVFVQTSGKAFSNLPEHTWADYNKMAPALPPFVQTALPIPPSPQLRPTSQTQPQPRPQPQMQPQMQPQQRPVIGGCCPPLMPAGPQNCCIQTPQTRSPYGLPPPYTYSTPNHFHTPNNLQGQQTMGYVGGNGTGYGYAPAQGAPGFAPSHNPGFSPMAPSSPMTPSSGGMNTPSSGGVNTPSSGGMNMSNNIPPGGSLI